MPPLYNRRPEFSAAPQPLPPVPLALTELLARVRQTLAERFDGSYWVVAEIAELTQPRHDGGHCYLVLSDQHRSGRGAELKAQARATIWSQRYQTLSTTFWEQTGQVLQAGLKVMLRVQVRFHEQYGLSLDVIAIDPTYTVGELARQRLLTVRKLEAKGLLDRQQRLPLALAPQQLAVISSPTAAGWQDFVQQLRESPYDFALTLFPATMQGTEAPASIRAALDAIRRRRGAYDAVVLIRGGGAKTDLLAFDDYGLAAAIGAFTLPVLTGIGHERDEAVVDLTAHLALKTPTAVATFLTDRLARLDAVFEGYAERIQELAAAQVLTRRHHLDHLARQVQAASKQQVQRQRLTLQQRLRLTAAAQRLQLKRETRQLTRLQQALPRVVSRQLAGQQRRVRVLGLMLARRFRRLHRRRREQLLRHRFQLQLTAERHLHQRQLRLAQATVYRLPANASLAAAPEIAVTRFDGQPLTDTARAGDVIRVELPETVLLARITARLAALAPSATPASSAPESASPSL